MLKKCIFVIVIVLLVFMLLVSCTDHYGAPYASDDRTFNGVPPGGPAPGVPPSFPWS